MNQHANYARRPRPAALQRERGMILVVTLIILVAMTLAAVTMLRSVDTSTLISGNLAFKQAATNSGDVGVEAAITWLEQNAAMLDEDLPGNGYYATSQDNVDLTGNKTAGNLRDDINWENPELVRRLVKDSVGNQVSYVIHRMCTNEGPLDGATCSTDLGVQPGASEGAGKQMLSYQPGSWGGISNKGYYRITAKVLGPKNNTSYVQAVVSR